MLKMLNLILKKKMKKGEREGWERKRMSKLAVAAVLITDSRNQGRDYKRKK